MVLGLIIWPSIGFLNAVISKPPTFFRSLLSGIRISAFLSLIFYVLVGWMIVIQGVNNYSATNLNMMTKALWPDAEATPEEAVDINKLFGGLEHIPETDRAAIVAKRIKADRFASLPYSLGFGVLFVVVFGVPVIYGTMIASILRKRNLPTWLFVLRYLIAWWTTSMLVVLVIGMVISMMLSPAGATARHTVPILSLFVIGILMLVIFLAVRRWKKSPDLVPGAS